MEPEVLIGVLATTLNVATEELTSTLTDEEGKFKEGAKDVLISQISNHIQSVKSSAKEEGKGWGVKEGRKSLEKDILSEFGIESTDKQGLELVKSVVSTKASQRAAELETELETLRKSKEFTDEDIKKSKAYVELEDLYSKSEQDKETAVTEAVSNLTNQWKAREVFSSVEKQARLYLENANPILPEDANKKDRQINALLVAELANYNYEVVGEGDAKIVFPLNKETGNRIENNLGHAMKVDALIEKISNDNFDFYTSDKKEFKKPDSKEGSIKLPETDAEFMDYIGDSKIPLKDREAIEKLYNERKLPFQIK